MDTSHSEISSLDFEVMISRCLSVKDTQGANSLREMAERHGYKINWTWVWVRAHNHRILWQLRKEAAGSFII